jgi:hypothetical protein
MNREINLPKASLAMIAGRTSRQKSGERSSHKSKGQPLMHRMRATMKRPLPSAVANKKIGES